MKITADMNVLVRAAVEDEPHQARVAAKLLQAAELVTVPIPVLCELVWVLGRGYKKTAVEISGAIRRLMAARNLVTNRPAVEAGLELLDNGGDFADGAIAYEGEWLGAEEFVSFDTKAVSRLQSLGHKARLLQ